MAEKFVQKTHNTEDCKIDVVRLAQLGGQHEFAHRLGVPAATLGCCT